jgi:hypothetical protein
MGVASLRRRIMKRDQDKVMKSGKYAILFLTIWICLCLDSCQINPSPLQKTYFEWKDIQISDSNYVNVFLSCDLWNN